MILNTCLNLRRILSPKCILLMYLIDKAPYSSTPNLRFCLYFLLFFLCIYPLQWSYCTYFLHAISLFLNSLTFPSSPFLIRLLQMLTVPRSFSWITCQKCYFYKLSSRWTCASLRTQLPYFIQYVLCFSRAIPPFFLHLNSELPEGRNFCSFYKVALDIIVHKYLPN